jgi:hypothetical protein
VPYNVRDIVLTYRVIVTEILRLFHSFYSFVNLFILGPNYRILIYFCDVTCDARIDPYMLYNNKDNNKNIYYLRLGGHPVTGDVRVEFIHDTKSNMIKRVTTINT